MHTGQIIKMYRKGMDISQRELEERANLPAKSVYFYEKGIREIPSKYLAAIAEVLEISLDELMGNSKKEPSVEEEIAEQVKLAALKALNNYKVERK